MQLQSGKFMLLGFGQAIALAIIEMIFHPLHLSRLILDPKLIRALVPDPTAKRRWEVLVPVSSSNLD
jgi:hypothetical protein